MMKLKTIAQAALLATGIVAAPLLAVACPVDSARPFNSGPFDPAGKQQGFFSEYVVDSNGIALQICTDGDGATPCFFDPQVPGNALSQALGRGGEAFYFLANNAFTTVGAFPLSAVLVLGVESAFLSAEPTAGFQTQFQRLRTRVNVSAVGIYTVETPWGKSVYRVDTLLPPGNGQNRMEISEPIDISFGADTTVPGLVTPFLKAVNKPALATLIDPATGQAVNPDDYIGDGTTLTPVTGSPCGTNFVRITATGLDGIAPIDINNGSNVVTNDQFTVMGKIAPKAKVPLAIGAAYYSRNGGTDRVTVMAQGSTSASQAAEMQVTVNGVALPLAKEFNRFHGTVPVTGTLPATIIVTASDSGRPSVPNTQIAPLKDLVTIGVAEARCSGTGVTKSCLLTVQASSSDDGSGAVTPTLTLQHNQSILVGGATTTSSAAVPAAVTVLSSQGGVASRPVTVINQ
jgi:hypothetical protein